MTMRAGGAVAELKLNGEVRLIGYGPGPARRTSATLNKLRLRAIVLEDSGGVRIALVSGDFWAASSWIHARVGGALAGLPALGLDRSKVFFSGTHTHCSPGGLYDSPYYANFAAAWPSDAGFDQNLAWDVAQQLVEVIKRACAALRPATLSNATGDFSTDSINRSYGAHVANDGGNSDDVYPEHAGRGAIDPTLELLVARDLNDQQLIGVWGAVNCHGTALGKNIDKLSPDFLGSAARKMEGHDAAVAVPHVLCSGAIGDVDPQPAGQTRAQFIKARESGESSSFHWMYRLADALQAAVEDALENNESDLEADLQFEAQRVDAIVANATLGTGEKMPDQPMVGDPVLFGSELGRGPFSYEGQRKTTPDGHLHWPKLSAHPFTLVVNAHLEEHEKHLSLSLFKLGDLLWLVGLPGEPTTRFSQNVKTALRAHAGGANLLLCGVNGGYNGYFVTPAEYRAQHYEGASCIWGPHTQTFVIEKLVELAKAKPAPLFSAAISMSVSTLNLQPLANFASVVAAAPPVPPPPTATRAQKFLEEAFAWVTKVSTDRDAFLEIGTTRIAPVLVKPVKRSGKPAFELRFLIRQEQLGVKARLVRVTPTSERFKLKASKAPR